MKSLSSSSPTILFVSTRQESTSTTVAVKKALRWGFSETVFGFQRLNVRASCMWHVSSFPSSKLSGLKESLSSSRETRCLLLEEHCSAGSTGTHTAAQLSLTGGQGQPRWPRVRNTRSAAAAPAAHTCHHHCAHSQTREVTRGKGIFKIYISHLVKIFYLFTKTQN